MIFGILCRLCWSGSNAEGRVVPNRNLGEDCKIKSVSNPITPGIGNKFAREIDYENESPASLNFTRYYNSLAESSNLNTAKSLTASLGSNWSHTYKRNIMLSESPTGATAYAYRPSGRVLFFQKVGAIYQPDLDVQDVLEPIMDGTGSLTGWRYTVATDDSVEQYDAYGTPIRPSVS